tara:strand:+ start:342 stop:1247 length:906 start_codon:yes stop_codon:yes gene_type:complete
LVQPNQPPTITAIKPIVVKDPISDQKLKALIEEKITATAAPKQVSAAMDAIFTFKITKQQLDTVFEAVFTPQASIAVMSVAVKSVLDGGLTTVQLASAFKQVFDKDLSDEDTVELAQEILAKPLSAEEFGTVVNAIFDEKVSDKVLIETFSAVLDTSLTESRFGQVVNVLESKTISNAQVADVVDLVISQGDGVAPEQAVGLVSSAKVLESVSGDQAVEVFGAVDEGALTVENGAEITEAVQEAPVAIRDAFQEEINVFGGVFDGYYPLGSMIDVGTRRVVVAGTGVLISAPVLASRRTKV